MACSASLLLKKKKERKEGAPGPLEAGERGLGSNGERSASFPLFRREKCIYIYIYIYIFLFFFLRMPSIIGPIPPQRQSTHLSLSPPNPPRPPKRTHKQRKEIPLFLFPNVSTSDLYYQHWMVHWRVFLCGDAPLWGR